MAEVCRALYPNQSGVVLGTIMNSRQQLRKQILELVKKFYSGDDKDSFTPGEDWIRFAGCFHDQNELMFLVDSALDFWLTAGRFSEQFETSMAEYLGVENVLLLNSSSSASLVALAALTSEKLKDRRLQPGDEVITLAVGSPNTINPIVQNRAIPVLVDVKLGSYVPAMETIESALSPKTKALLLGHTMGVPSPVSEAREFCDRHGLWLVEDNSDAFGSLYDGKLTGTYGDLATWSFHADRHLIMGEGGAVSTGNEDLARIVRSFRDWGRDCYCSGGESNTCGKRFGQQFGFLPFGYDHKYVYSHIGYNFKLTDMQAAVGVAQLDKIGHITEARKRNHAALGAGLARYDKYLVLHSAPAKADPSWLGFVVTILPEAPFTRAALIAALESAKIETRILFSGNILRHPAYADIQHRTAGALPNSDLITANTFCLGAYPGLTPGMIEHILSTVGRFIAEADAKA